MTNVHLLDLIEGISSALDQISATVTGHHRRVGIAAALTGKAMNHNVEDLTDLFMAGLLHDVGAFSLQGRIDGLEFDFDLTEHADIGYRLLKDHHLLERTASMVRYHHTPWESLQRLTTEENPDTLFLSNIVNLVDRVDILGNVGNRTVDRDRIRTILGANPKNTYSPLIQEAFMDISAGPEFWEMLETPKIHAAELIGSSLLEHCIPMSQLLKFSNLFAHIIDFRSSHTATHSQGVAEIAALLAKMAGMSETDQQRMRLAGSLHDIGKLAVPVALLDKPAALATDEYDIMKKHAVICEDILKSIPGLDTIADWACQHHERYDGKGYPNNLGKHELSLGSQIMAVADVFTAISEDRPYRAGMDAPTARGTLSSMADDGSLSPELITLVLDNFEQLDSVRRSVQSQVLAEFRHFRKL